MNLKDFESDWRNMGQLEYLYKKSFAFRRYSNNMKRTHEHCQFCWEKFSIFPDTLHAGYCTMDKNEYWVCTNCFSDFKDIFEWEILMKK